MCTCWKQKTSCVAVVPSRIVFSMRWHPSKLMGCNHHHKYSVKRPTAHSWVFNSQSMGCKEWQAWGTQFPISLTTLSERCQRIQKIQKSSLFTHHLWGLQRGTSIRSAWDIQSIILTQCFTHPSTILIKVTRSQICCVLDRLFFQVANPARVQHMLDIYLSPGSMLLDFWLYITQALTPTHTHIHRLLLQCQAWQFSK